MDRADLEFTAAEQRGAQGGVYYFSYHLEAN